MFMYRISDFESNAEAYSKSFFNFYMFHWFFPYILMQKRKTDMPPLEGPEKYLWPIFFDGE